MTKLEWWLLSVLWAGVLVLLAVGCAHVHPPMVCQAARSQAGAQVMVCVPIAPEQIRQGGDGDV